MTQKRSPAKGAGGFGTASTFGSLDGWTLAEADEYLSNHPDLKRTSITEHGYRLYQFKDGSELWIRPDGEILRVPYKLYDSDGKPLKGLRISVATGKVMYSNVWHNLPRDEHEWVVMNDNTN